MGQSTLLGYGDYGETVQTDTLEILSAAENYNRWIFSIFAPSLRGRVMEVGCGIGTYTQMMLETPSVEQVTALEMMPEYIERLQKRVQVPQGKVLDARCQNLLEDPTGLQNHDGVIMLNVLEHIEDDGACLKALSALLNPGGKLMLLVPALQSLYSDYDRSINHYRRYTTGSLRKVIEASGYRLSTLRYFNMVGIAGWWVRFCMMRQVQFDPNSVRLFNAMAPALQAVETLIPPPLGLSVVAVAEKI